MFLFTLKRKQPGGNFIYKKENIDGVDYIWVYGNKYSGNGIMRALNIITYSFLSCFLFFYLRKDYKVLINSSTHTIDIFPLLTYKFFNKLFFRSKKIISVFEPHDLWPMVLTEIGKMSKYHPFVLINSIGEKLSSITSDLIVSMHPGNINHLELRGANRNDFYHIPNGINVDDWSDKENLPIDIEKKLTKIQSSGARIIMYAGTISVANDLSFIINAIPRVKQKIVPIFFGSGTEVSSLKKLCKDLEVEAYFFGSIEKKQIPSALKFADICYVGFLKNKLYKYGVSANKIWDYMMSSKPIILTINSCNDPITDANCGITVKTHKQEDLVDAINNLVSMSRKDLKQLGMNGRSYVIKNNAYDTISDNFMNILNTYLNEK